MAIDTQMLIGLGWTKRKESLLPEWEAGSFSTRKPSKNRRERTRNMVKKLTPLQERFLLFYRQCGDAAEAAGMAGYRRDLQKAGKRNLTLLKEWLDDPEKKTDGKEENMRKPDVWEEPSAPEEDETAGEEEVMRVLTRIIHRKEADHVDRKSVV